MRKTDVAKPGQPTSAAARVDRDLVATAYRKLANGKELTQRERTALKRHEKDKEERLRWEYYGSVSKKHYLAMSGRQAKVVNEQAQRYDLPIGGKTINLPALIRRFHDFLAENAVKLARDDDDLMTGGNSPALERYREERAALAKLDRQERENELLPREDVKQALGRVASILRGAGDTLQQQYGQDAVDILYEALDDAERQIERFFGDTDGDDDQLDKVA